MDALSAEADGAVDTRMDIPVDGAVDTRDPRRDSSSPLAGCVFPADQTWDGGALQDGGGWLALCVRVSRSSRVRRYSVLGRSAMGRMRRQCYRTHPGDPRAALGNLVIHGAREGGTDADSPRLS